MLILCLFGLIVEVLVRYKQDSIKIESNISYPNVIAWQLANHLSESDRLDLQLHPKTIVRWLVQFHVRLLAGATESSAMALGNEYLFFIWPACFDICKYFIGSIKLVEMTIDLRS